MSASPPDAHLPETARLLAIVARLRGPGGCPWDREQTLASLRPYLIEECYELLDAVDAGEPDAHRDELGDVLLQVALQAQIRDEEGRFNFEAVARTLADKLVRRHPHVFGDVQVQDSQEVVKNWEAIKVGEREAQPKPKSLLDGLPRSLPALPRAQKMQARAARAGFDWPDVDGVLQKLDEELGELRAAKISGDSGHVEDELGDLLFTVVNLCRFLKINAEQALRRANTKFSRRFRAIESALQAEGKRVSDATPEELNRHWDSAKARESNA